MITGSGLIATALARGGADAVERTCFFAAGVSNSGCTDQREYLRERARLDAIMASCPASTQMVYFSTCSIEDPDSRDSEYVKHKIRMEGRIRERPRHLILRLPQVAGSTPNPHTLLNFLHARITRSERFHVWRGATRNVIDVEDVVKIALDLIATEGANAETINVASPRSSTILDIVRIMERALGARAVCDIVDKGSAVRIETFRVATSARRCAIAFDSGYLGGVIEKYYGAPIREIDASPPAVPASACPRSCPAGLALTGQMLTVPRLQMRDRSCLRVASGAETSSKKCAAFVVPDFSVVRISRIQCCTQLKRGELPAV